LSVPVTADKRRIVVADDSRLMRRMLSDALGKQGFDVVATAADGDEALAACDEHRPDALTLDLAMPGMDGIGVLKALRAGRAQPVPVVVVSAFSPAHGARAVDALAEGAFDLVAKPAFGESLATFSSELGRKVAEAAHSGRVRRPTVARRPVERRPAVVHPAAPRTATGKLVVIACSTGGPKALAELVPRLPSPLGAGTLIVQHMPAGFTASLAARLDGASALTVREAGGGELLAPDVALLAPGGSHLRLADDRRVRLSDEEPLGGLRPRADLTIADAARVFGRKVVLVVLTGMGKDGLTGAEGVRRAGGRILTEAESTCTVYGMPRAVEEAGLSDQVLELDELADAIAREVAS
jgi:two-component system, chemotaxis family, protein-glutamate methylesterase/glutaminase